MRPVETPVGAMLRKPQVTNRELTPLGGGASAELTASAGAL
jgi:hypothetical protein